MRRRTFLDLTHNPFVAPHSGFFDGANRRISVQKMLAVDDWPAPVMVVSGSFGMGKTSMCEAFFNDLPASLRAARLSGLVVNSEREVLAGLSQGFILPVTADQSVNALIEQLKALLTQTTPEQRWVAVVDDAHLLVDRALRCLLQLSLTSNLHLVLLMEASGLQSVRTLGKSVGIDQYVLQLPGMDGQAIRDYLEWRFAQAHYRGRMPFTDGQVLRIVAQSRGNPGLVDTMANRLLGDLETGQPSTAAGRYLGMHVAMVTSLALLTGLGYQVMQRLGEPDPARDNAEVMTSLAAAPVQVAQTAEAEETPVYAGSGVQAGNPEPMLTPPAVEPGPASSTSRPPPAVSAAVLSDPVARTGPVEQLAAQPAQPVAAPAGAVPSAATASIERGLVWVLAQEPEEYTLQLVTLSVQARAEAFIAAQSNPSEFALHPVRRNGKQLYVVTYGRFTTRRAAQRAVAALSPELQRLAPWIRQFGQVQAGLTPDTSS